MIHELKCIPKFYPYYKMGSKNSSMRKNDRNFAVGDIVLLKLWQDDGFILNEIVVKKISHIVHDYDFSAIKNNYCILSLKDV